ncbi:MAG: hypothetical protein C0402_09760 [Thermodesulfovibrio sp.]|nr:hypothetical protein [Thermodesulfovibrio sp.]
MNELMPVIFEKGDGMFSKLCLFSLVLVLLWCSAGYAAECNGGGRYDDNNDGTVTDCRTGLVWLKNASCNETSGGIGNSAGTLYWDEAVKWVAGLGHGICGLSDGSSNGAWRLPTKTEWMAMVENARKLGFSNPALTDGSGSSQWTGSGGNTFSLVQSDFYWSTTTNPSTPTQAWSVFMGDGKVYSVNKDNLLPVWPVRAGQIGSFGSLHIH